MTEPVLEPDTTGFEIATDGISGLIVGYDGTDPSEDALAYAAGIARRGHAALTIVFVRNLPGATGLAPSGYAAATQALDDTVEELRGRLKQLHGDLPAGAEFVVADGDVATELERVADERRADAIVVGRSHSRTHQVAGSATVHLVRHANRPVVVVP